MEKTPGLEAAYYTLERSQRLRIVKIVLPAMVGILLTIFTINVSDNYFLRRLPFPKELVFSIAFVLFAFSVLSGVMVYLQTGFKRSTTFDFESLKNVRENERAREAGRIEIAEITTAVRTELLKVQSEIKKVKNLAVNASDRSALVAQLKAQITSEANAEALNELKAQVAADFRQEFRDKDLLQRFDESRSRLTKELDALGRRGNLNLALGAVTTIVGLVLLGLSVFSELIASKDLWTFISHFFPRLTLVVMIELFAYFFLSLYKTNLQEIKYFQNELTNVESKQIALRAALTYAESSMVADIVAKLAMTERNHVLTKDQTTVELEKCRIDKDANGELAKSLLELFQRKT